MYGWQRHEVLRPSARGRFRARRLRARALDLYRTFIQPDDLCFDVGANMGDRTALFLALGARVVAFEPQPACARRLRRRFGRDVDVVEVALGARAGTAELLVASYHTLSSLSAEWVAAVTASGRFAEFAWGDRITVAMTTIDDAIARYGVPSFCKIDVEGYELEVVQGLSHAVPALSFEFTRERLHSRLAAVDRLTLLGMTSFNLSLGESMELALPSWVDAREMRAFLDKQGVDVFGDVYARVPPRRAVDGRDQLREIGIVRAVESRRRST